MSEQMISLSEKELMEQSMGGPWDDALKKYNGEIPHGGKVDVESKKGGIVSEAQEILKKGFAKLEEKDGKRRMKEITEEDIVTLVEGAFTKK